MREDKSLLTLPVAGSFVSMTLIVAICVVLLQFGPAHAQSALRGYTCAQVREAVVRYGGPENAEALARGQGGTDQEIAAAKRCLIQPVHFRRSVSLR